MPSSSISRIVKVVGGVVAGTSIITPIALSAKGGVGMPPPNQSQVSNSFKGQTFLSSQTSGPSSNNLVQLGGSPVSSLNKEYNCWLVITDKSGNSLLACEESPKQRKNGLTLYFWNSQSNTKLTSPIKSVVARTGAGLKNVTLNHENGQSSTLLQVSDTEDLQWGVWNGRGLLGTCTKKIESPWTYLECVGIFDPRKITKFNFPK